VPNHYLSFFTVNSDGSKDILFDTPEPKQKPGQSEMDFMKAWNQWSMEHSGSGAILTVVPGKTDCQEQPVDPEDLRERIKSHPVQCIFNFHYVGSKKWIEVQSSPTKLQSPSPVIRVPPWPIQSSVAKRSAP
jgi:hypothetical protein